MASCDSRFEFGVEQDVVAVQLEAVLVVDDHALNTLSRFDEDLVNFGEAILDLHKN